MQWYIGPFRLDQDHACLWQGDERLVPRPKTFDLLVYLVEHAGQLVTKDELLSALWPDTVVAESVLTVSVSELRKMLGENARSPQFIATEHRRGYRFIATVTPLETPEALASCSPPEPLSVEAPKAPALPTAERRQLSVLFCDLVDSTRLAGQLDPEDLRDVLHAYHQSCAEVVARFDGYLAQYLGDGVLMYFGYPVAHEDDAQRAVWSGLGLLQALQDLNARLSLPAGYALAVRLGMHTGLVVVGDVGAGDRQETLAQGGTPHLAVYLHNLAKPNELVVSSATRELLGGMFRLKDLGEQMSHSGAAPIRAYRVEGAEAVESRFEAMTVTGLTPLVGREGELELLWRHWQQATEGEGRVVLLSGEAGLGKSRLTQALCERLADETYLRVLYQCSPYHANSAFHPIITNLERFLQLDQVRLPTAKLDRLETLLAQAGLAVEPIAPLLASLLSIATGDRYAPHTMSPEAQKEQTMAAWAELVVGLSKREPVLVIFEDAHWSDPTTLEALAYLLDCAQTARVLLVITFRPEFVPPWNRFAHVTAYTLNSLTRQQVVSMVERLVDRSLLSDEHVEQIVSKTDGVPLFVEELTKTILESAWHQSDKLPSALTEPTPPLPLPATLQDSLMSRLDRIPTAREIAQIGAVLGRDFTYDILHAITPLDDEALQHGLTQLVQAEILHQRGQPPQAHYQFKHALVQEVAAASLLRSRRQDIHYDVARALETPSRETRETEPELLAHHYTEARRPKEAMTYWLQAGQLALTRSAYAEAIHHMRHCLAMLATLPETPERVQQEIDCQLMLGRALMARHGVGDPDVERTYARALSLNEQAGENPQLFPALWGLWRFYHARAQHRTTRELGEKLLKLAQDQHHPAWLLAALQALGTTLYFVGEFTQARSHLEQGLSLYASQQSDEPASVSPALYCLVFSAQTLWLLGYPDQALRQSLEAYAFAQELMDTQNLAFAQYYMARTHFLRRETHEALQYAESNLSLSIEHKLAYYTALSLFLRGAVLAKSGQVADGVAQMRQGLHDALDTGAMLVRPLFVPLLAEGCGTLGQFDEAFGLLRDACAAAASVPCFNEAEMYRLQGELYLQQAIPDAAQAEACFDRAGDIARQQQAKSWELRAAVSLSRLWLHQGKRQDAYELLAPVYHWFTEGLGTADLQEAHAMLTQLSTSD